MRKLIVMALAVGCLGVLASVAMAATKSVKVGDNYYVRPSGVPKRTRSPSSRARSSSTPASTAPAATRRS